MEMLNSIGAQLVASFLAIWEQIVMWLPRVVGALVVLLIGGYIASLLRKLTKQLFHTLKVESFSERFHLHEKIRSMGLDVTLTHLIAGFVYWMVLLVFVSSSATLLGVEVVTRFIDRMIGFIPSIFAGMAIMVIGVMVADTLSHMMENVKMGGSYKMVVRAFILVIAFITAIEQIGIDVSFLAGNIQILVAGLSLALGLAFGLGGRDRAKQFVDKYLP